MTLRAHNTERKSDCKVVQIPRIKISNIPNPNSPNAELFALNYAFKVGEGHT